MWTEKDISALAGFVTIVWWRHQSISYVLKPVEIAELHPTHHRVDTGYGKAFRYHRRRLANAVVVAASDMAAILCAMLLAGGIRWLVLGQAMVPSWTVLLVVAWWAGAYMSGLLPSWGLGIVTELRRTVMLLVVLFSATALILFLAKQGAAMSRLTVSLGFLIALPFVPIGRMLAKRALIRKGAWGVPVVLYSDGGGAARVIRALREESGLGYVPVGVFDDHQELWGDTLEGVPVLGGTEQTARGASVAVLVTSGMPHERAAVLLEGPVSKYKQAVVVPDLFDVPSLWVKSRDMAGILGLEITSNLLDPFTQAVKRALDLLLVLATFPLWGPLYIIVAAAIYVEDRESPLYFQERIGRDGRLFRIPKFRSMQTDAEDVLDELVGGDGASSAEWRDGFKLRRDPRVTRVGAFLRRWSLDELPQLVSVLRGDMSLVGPRPLPEYHLSMLPNRLRDLRARVRPGMTGQWQVSGRSDVGTEGMERWDAFYVRNWSVWLDAVILVRTVGAVLRGKGAY